MSKLLEICEKRKNHIADLKLEAPLIEIKSRIAETERRPRGFINALRNCKDSAIIAEFKRSSPSLGDIRKNASPKEVSFIYEKAGACCMSVLTEPEYFSGSDDDLIDVVNHSSLPVLRKDFVVDEYQIYESRAIGADCMLLIMAALDDIQAKDFYDCITELGMDTLVEIHDEIELERALFFEPKMIGINNRNLKTLEVDLNTSHKLSKQLPKGVLRVSESGIESRQQVETLEDYGYDAFLIGGSIMSSSNISDSLKNLIRRN